MLNIRHLTANLNVAFEFSKHRTGPHVQKRSGYLDKQPQSTIDGFAKEVDFVFNSIKLATLGGRKRDNALIIREELRKMRTLHGGSEGKMELERFLSGVKSCDK